MGPMVARPGMVITPQGFVMDPPAYISTCRRGVPFLLLRPQYTPSPRRQGMRIQIFDRQNRLKAGSLSTPIPMRKKEPLYQMTNL
ncbi:hypothetical protein VTN00DRAFT_7388 [Thermoascus crustaceus]|uniref:uncharacterized protein n=1 Tax=Thermoascus crustaceus TaxID=5088 RepID=UPI0037441FB1